MLALNLSHLVRSLSRVTLAFNRLLYDSFKSDCVLSLPTVKEYYKIQYENIVSKIKKDDADYPFAIYAVIKAVADFFDVSERAMSIRLKSLGLI